MNYGLYIHLPFCRRKCPYCSFISITHAEKMMESYAEAVYTEITLRSAGIFSGSPQKLYIGGGTPSMFPAGYIEKILSGVSLLDTTECTVEANPDSLTVEWLERLLKRGINRISIGIQSLDDAILSHLGRLHTARQAVTSVAMARRAGFHNLSTDLMFGVPGQTIKKWEDTLKRILELEVEHVSCYSLSMEEDTEFYTLALQDKLSLPDPAETSDMYLLAVDILTGNGFCQYEISNFARPGYECKHNLGYWNFTPYMGTGASSHSFDGNNRRWNVSDPAEYVKRCASGKDPVQGSEVIDSRKRGLEKLMLSLRVSGGLNMNELRDDPLTGNSLAEKMELMIKNGFMEHAGGNIRLTVRGKVIADEIISEIAADFY
jgi:oxygen-independent coproporphyrinogen III oxidase